MHLVTQHGQESGDRSEENEDKEVDSFKEVKTRRSHTLSHHHPEVMSSRHIHITTTAALEKGSKSPTNNWKPHTNNPPSHDETGRVLALAKYRDPSPYPIGSLDRTRRIRWTSSSTMPTTTGAGRKARMRKPMSGLYITKPPA